jgi:hypothetical protein
MPIRTPKPVAFVVAFLVVLLPAVARGAVAVEVSAGAEHQCVVDDAGALACWGRNLFGDLGTGDLADRGAPTTVSGLGSGVASVSAGQYHTCAVTTAGGLKCWGSNYNGQLGDGTKIDRSTPVDVSGLTSGVAAVAAGARMTCALTTGGGVKCWGEAAIGNGTSASLTPADVLGLSSGVTAIATGAEHACALTTAGGVECWGSSTWGQLGNGMTMYRYTPSSVSGLTSGVASIAAGWRQTCAVTTAGAVKCWGQNPHGVLGDGTTVDRLVPADVIGLGSGVARIATHLDDDYPTSFVSCAVMTTGALQCWSSIVGAVADPWFASGVSRVATGTNTFVVTTDGELRQRFGRNKWVAGCVQGFGDDDGDELCESYDPCDTQSGGQAFPGLRADPAKMVLSRINTETTPGNDQMVLKSRFELPAGKTFADLSPASTGARIVTLSPRGTTSTFAIPPGVYAGKGTAGWTLQSGAKSRWTFTDATGAPGTKTVTVLKLGDLGPGTAGGRVDLSLTARAGSFPIGPDDFPLQVHVLLDDSTPGANGLCGEGRFNCECRFGVSGKALNCNAHLRRPEVCE